MSGKWSFDGGTPVRPGFYIDYRNTATTSVAGGAFGTVAMPVTADWGPIDEVVSITSEGSLINTFGPDDGTGATTSYLVREALIGGAKEVKVVRIADGTEAKSTKVLGNVTPTGTALTLTAKYHGLRGDDFTVTVRENPLDNTKNDLIIYENGIEREIYTHTKASVTALGATINADSNLVDATVAVGGVALATVTASAFTGGDSGTSTVAADYLNAQDILEREGGWDIYVMDGISDSSIKTAAIAWIEDLNNVGQYSMIVVGGPDSETVGAGITLAEGYDSEYVVSFGGGDIKMTLADGTEVTRNTAEGAPRIAGVIAAAGITGSATRAQLPGIAAVTPLTKAEAEAAIAGGMLTLTKRQGVTIIEDGITTFTSFTDEKDETFATISNIRAMQQIGFDLDYIFENEWLGKVRNTTTAQNALVTRAKDYFKKLEAQNVLITGTEVELDTRFDNTGYAVYLLVNAQFGLELKKILITLRAPQIAA